MFSNGKIRAIRKVLLVNIELEIDVIRFCKQFTFLSVYIDKYIYIYVCVYVYVCACVSECLASSKSDTNYGERM